MPDALNKGGMAAPALAPDPEYGMVIAKDVMVPMRDGVKLATDIYRPARDGQARPRIAFPPFCSARPTIRTTCRHTDIARFFIPRGYVDALQDVRGRHDSEVMARVLQHR